MSKKSKIFSYFTGKRKIGHSKFDMSFSNTYTQGFGALNPVAVYETLPDDYWNIGSDGVTLLKPLAAPAFSDIKNHMYAFSVRNSAVWKHWNSFITNGTAFSDVYGSNASNQASDNPWKVPSIPALYLQDICKFANGYNVEVHSFEIDDFDSNAFFKKFFEIFTFTCDYPYLQEYDFDITSAVMLFIESDSFMSDINASSLIREVFRDCLLGVDLHFASDFDVSNATVVFYLACSQTFANYFSSLFRSTQTNAASTTVNPSPSETSDFGVVLDSQLTSIPDGSPYGTISWASFYDDCTSMCRRSLSPFIIEFVKVADNDHVNKDVRYKVRYVDGEVVYEGNRTSSLFTYRSCDTNFLGRSYIFAANTSSGGSNISISDYSSAGVFHWNVSDGSLLFNNIPDMRDSFVRDSFFKSIVHKVRPYFGVVRPLSDTLHRRYYDNSVCNWYNCEYAYFNTAFQYDRLQGISSVTNVIGSARSLGYTGSGFLIYLAKNSERLLSSFNFPVAALATRSYDFYRYEEFNALPLFGYSKIWDEYFRSSVVSSPELNFEETNGSILFDSRLREYLSNSDIRTPAVLPEKYANMSLNDIKEMPLNGWAIPFEAIPLNSMLNEGVTAVSSGSLVASLSGHHNLLMIQSREDVFAILTGYNLDRMVVNKMYHLFQSQTAASNISYSTFSELFTKNFYLPSYYNGLCHLKFQNFNKDYFTAAMLDPMSGANSVNIGTTVNDLRTAEAKQSWYERIAPQRSVEGFMEAIFGITPLLDRKEPNFLGSTHVKINIGEVIQTSSSTPESPQGQRVGIGGARGGSSLVHGHVNEHGFLFILSSFTVESQYHQGVESQLLVKQSYMDYPTIDFANIGNQSILMKELNFDGQAVSAYNLYGSSVRSNGQNMVFFDHRGSILYGVGSPYRVTTSDPSLATFPYQGGLSNYLFKGLRNFTKGSGTALDSIFGYIPRYSNYKFKLDQVHGEFEEELSSWHTFRNLYGMPILSHEFVNWELCVDDNEFNRIFAVTTNEDGKFCCETFFTASVDRALPYVCVPQSK